MVSLENVLKSLNRDPVFSTKYTVSDEKINGGGSAVIMKGARRFTDPTPSVDVAVKIVAENLVLNDGVRYPIVGPGVFPRLKNEFEILSQLQHPHIVKAYDFAQTGSIAYMVMEFVDGPNLYQQLQFGKPPSLSAAKQVEMLVRVAEAVAYVHAQGFVHRDVKPSNIVINALSYNPKLIDFDIATKVSASVATAPQLNEGGTIHGPVGSISVGQLRDLLPSIRSGVVRGTLGYMSREQLRDLSPTPMMDIFSFGALLYEVVTGECLIRQGSIVASDGARYLEPPMYFPIPMQVPAFQRISLVDNIVKKCCQPNPADRYASMGEVVRDLHTLHGLMVERSPGDAL